MSPEGDDRDLRQIFISRAKDELFAWETCRSVLQARVLYEDWRRAYNRDHPRSALGFQALEVYAAARASALSPAHPGSGQGVRHAMTGPRGTRQLVPQAGYGQFLGIESSPAYVREHEGNGVAERFIRTLKEQLVWVQHFETVADLERGLQVFKQRYNQQWLVSKHDYRTPQQARALLALESAA